MLITCPNCRALYSFDGQQVGPSGIKLRCSSCRAIFRAVRKAAGVETPLSQISSQSGNNRIVVLVAHHSESFCAAVAKILAFEQVVVHFCHDGREALSFIENNKPAVALLDVALTSLYGFEVCEEVRQNSDLCDVKLILIASIYDKSKFKRAPHSLYGADEYIEKHQIPDLLTPMVRRLIAGRSQSDVDNELPADEVQALDLQSALDQDESCEELAQQENDDSFTQDADVQLTEAHLKAQRLARIIVSDIALYNQKQVENGIRNDTFFELLANDIEEGKTLYCRRVSEDIRKSTSYLEEAFQSFIAKKKIELNL